MDCLEIRQCDTTVGSWRLCKPSKPPCRDPRSKGFGAPMRRLRQPLPHLSPSLTRVCEREQAAPLNHTDPPTTAARLQVLLSLGIIALRDLIAFRNVSLLWANERQRNRASRPSKIPERADYFAANRALCWQLEDPSLFSRGGCWKGRLSVRLLSMYGFQLSGVDAKGVCRTPGCADIVLDSAAPHRIRLPCRRVKCLACAYARRGK